MFLFTCVLILGGVLFFYSSASLHRNDVANNYFIDDKQKFKPSIIEGNNKTTNKGIVKQPSKINKQTISEPSVQNTKAETLSTMNDKLQVLVGNLDQNLQGKDEKNKLVRNLRNASNYRQLVLKKAKENNKEIKN